MPHWLTKHVLDAFIQAGFGLCVKANASQG
jgi:hypothetical protein